MYPKLRFEGVQNRPNLLKNLDNIGKKVYIYLFAYIVKVFQKIRAILHTLKTQFWVHLSISKNHPDNPENIHIRNFPIFLFV